MKNFIEGREEQAFLFTNNQVSNIVNLNGDFNKNHTAKILLAQIEVYQIIISNLLENETKQKYRRFSRTI